MSIYEARLQADLEAIGRRVDAVAGLVVGSVESAIEAFVSGDHLRSYRIGLEDKAINRETRAIDSMCHEFVARHFPAAGHLRFVSSVLRLDVALERIGDYAVNIARRSVLLKARPSEQSRKVVDAIGASAVGLLQESVTAWSERDVEAANSLIRRSRSFTQTHERRLNSLLKDDDPDLRFVVHDVLYNLIRVGSQARNLCEETIFTTTGQSKEPKVYKVLFVGEKNARLSLLAEAFANKAFPNSGQYASAGWAPAEAAAPDLAALAAGAGIDVDGAAPRDLAEELPRLGDYHVIVGLRPGALEHLGDVPYRTVFLQWDREGEVGRAEVQAVCGKVRELMVALRGDEAN